MDNLDKGYKGILFTILITFIWAWNYFSKLKKKFGLKIRFKKYQPPWVTDEEKKSQNSHTNNKKRDEARVYFTQACSLNSREKLHISTQPCIIRLSIDYKDLISLRETMPWLFIISSYRIFFLLEYDDTSMSIKISHHWWTNK